MAIKELSITKIDFKELKSEDVFKWLELFGFKRYIHPHWIDPARSKNDQYPEDHISESPERLYTACIVPQHHKGKFLWMIDSETFEKIKTVFESLQNKENVKNGEPS